MFDKTHSQNRNSFLETTVLEVPNATSYVIWRNSLKDDKGGISSADFP